MRAGRGSDALALRRKMLAANPLDKRTRVMTAYAILAAARRAVIDGDFAAAEQVLDVNREIATESKAPGFFALKAVLARKAGRKDDAAAMMAQAVACPGGRLAAHLYVAVDTGLAKLKPAEKTAANKVFTAAQAEPPTPQEVNLLYAAWDEYHLGGVKYVGQPAQEKKIFALIGKAVEAGGSEFDLEVMARSLAVRHEWTVLRKTAKALAAKFPANPVFPLLLAEDEFAKADGDPPPHKVAKHLVLAKRLAEQSPEPRHRALLEQITEMQHAAAPDDLFEYFFQR